jgi:hypothetical protein
MALRKKAKPVIIKTPNMNRARLAISPKESRFAVGLFEGKNAGSVLIWSAGEKEPQVNITLGMGEVWVLQWLDDCLFAVCKEGFARLSFDGKILNKTPHTIQFQFYSILGASPDGSQLLTTQDKRVGLAPSPPTKILWKTKSELSYGGAIYWSKEHGIIVVANETFQASTSKMVSYDLAGKERWTYKIEGGTCHALTTAGDRAWFITTNYKAQKALGHLLVCLDLTKGSIVWKKTFPTVEADRGYSNGIQSSLDGASIALCLSERTEANLAVYDGQSGEELWSGLHPGYPPQSFGFTPDRKTLISTGCGDPSLRLWAID